MQGKQNKVYDLWYSVYMNLWKLIDPCVKLTNADRDGHSPNENFCS